MGNQNNNTDLLMQAINGNKDAINTLSTNLNCDVKSIDNALCSIQNAIGKVGGEVGFSAERVINAVNAIVFEARHTPAEASAELPVLISPTGSVSPAANTKNIPVVKADSSPLTGSEIAAGNRYFIYYNKCDNVMQVMNHYPTAAPAA